MTPAGIEPVTFRFVAQHLNHCATAVLWYNPVFLIKIYGCDVIKEVKARYNMIKYCGRTFLIYLFNAFAGVSYVLSLICQRMLRTVGDRRGEI